MGFVPASPRFGRCKLASLIVAAVALAGGVAAAGPARTVLVFPARGHWMLEPLREKLSEALPEALQQAGFEVVTVRPDSPLVLQARRERPLTVVGGEATPEQLEEGRYALAVLGGFDAVLTAEVTGGDGGVLVQAELAGAVSRRPVRLEARAASTDAVAAPELAKQLAAAITPEVWQQAGADAEGRRAGAAERYAAGRAAMEAHRALEAREQFEAALAGDGENPDYLRAAAEADVACGDMEAALGRLQTAVRLRPDDPEARLRLGEAALRVGRLELAEASFRAASLALPDDPRVVEGLARTYRASGDAARARDQYLRLVGLVPALREEPASLVALLAGLGTDQVRFAGLSDEEATRALALLYLQQGETERGINALYRYHKEAERPAYSDPDYALVARRLDEEANLLARRSEELLRVGSPSESDDAGMEQGLVETHDRSERLADVAEKMRVPDHADAAQRYRVLAYNLLNESDFEALLYARTNDASHERRASLLREACRKALQEAATLGGRESGIGDRGSGTAGTEESRSRGVEESEGAAGTEESNPPEAGRESGTAGSSPGAGEPETKAPE